MIELVMAAMLATNPVEARLIGVDVRRPRTPEPTWYNRVTVELESAEARLVRLCPGDAKVQTERAYGDTMRPVDRFGAHALILEDGTHASSCQELTLGPAPQTVTFLVNNVPGRWRAEDRYTFEFAVGHAAADKATRFRFVEDRSARR